MLRFAENDWIILEKSQGNALLITKECVAKKAYKDGWEKGDLTWENSDIYSYLQYEFPTELILYKKHLTNVNGCCASLLSGTEFTKYEQYIPTIGSPWWLRDTVLNSLQGNTKYFAQAVYKNEVKSWHASQTDVGVRPIIRFAFEDM